MINRQYLLIGGPHHSQETPDKGAVYTVMVQVPENYQGIPVGTAVTTNYIKRGIEAELEGYRYKQEFYVHESLNPEQTTSLLTNLLLGKWIQEGEVVGTVEQEGDTSHLGLSRPSQGNEGMAEDTPRSASGLYLPN